jgi:hypothetical protein
VTVRSISGAQAEFTVVVSCPAGGAACAAASLKVTVKEHLKGSSVTSITAQETKKKAPPKTKVVVVASGAVTLSAGAKETSKLRLNSTGRALLSKFQKLTALVTVSSRGKTLKTAIVTLREPTKKKK